MTDVDEKTFDAEELDTLNEIPTFEDLVDLCKIPEVRDQMREVFVWYSGLSGSAVHLKGSDYLNSGNVTDEQMEKACEAYRQCIDGVFTRLHISADNNVFLEMTKPVVPSHNSTKRKNQFVSGSFHYAAYSFSSDPSSNRKTSGICIPSNRDNNFEPPVGAYFSTLYRKFGARAVQVATNKLHCGDVVRLNAYDTPVYVESLRGLIPICQDDTRLFVALLLYAKFSTEIEACIEKINPSIGATEFTQLSEYLEGAPENVITALAPRVVTLHEGGDIDLNRTPALLKKFAATEAGTVLTS